MALLSNPTFWVGVAFAIFFLILLKYKVPSNLARSLDERADKIAYELSEARRLRQDAMSLLAQYQAKSKSAEAEAQAIVKAAKEEAERLAQESEERLAEFIKRRTASAEAKIAQAEQQAMADVKAAAANAALKAAERVIRHEMAGNQGEAYLGKSLNEIKTRLN